MFDMPDYTSVGRTIMRLTHSYDFDDEPLHDTGMKDDIPLEINSYGLSLSELGLFILTHSAPGVADPDFLYGPTEDDNPFRLMAGQSKSIPPKVRPGPRSARAGVATSVTPSTASTTVARSKRPSLATRSVSRVSAVAKSTATSGTGPRTASSRPGTAGSVPTRRLNGASVATNAAVVGGAAATGQKFMGTTANARNRAGSITLGTTKTQAVSTPLRRPVASTFASKSSAASSVVVRGRTTRSVASTPIAGRPGTVNATGLVDEADLVLKFDSATGDEGVDDFMFDI
jgi:hypothetical protein